MKNLLIASILLSVFGCASSSSSVVDSEVLKNQTIDLTKNNLSEYIVFGNVGLGWGVVPMDCICMQAISYLLIQLVPIVKMLKIIVFKAIN
jgi:hypothetical protein